MSDDNTFLRVTLHKDNRIDYQQILSDGRQVAKHVKSVLKRWRLRRSIGTSCGIGASCGIVPLRGSDGTLSAFMFD